MQTVYIGFFLLNYLTRHLAELPKIVWGSDDVKLLFAEIECGSQNGPYCKLKLRETKYEFTYVVIQLASCLFLGRHCSLNPSC